MSMEQPKSGSNDFGLESEFEILELVGDMVMLPVDMMAEVSEGFLGALFGSDNN